MTLQLFDAHPEVKSWNEPRTVWVYADPRRRHDRFDESDATERVKRYIRSRFLKYQREHGGRRVMEKTPSNIMRIPYVREIFPESKFVYIVRDPLGNLSSSEIRWRTPIGMDHAWDRFLETPKTQVHYYVWRAFVDHFRTRVLKHRHVSIWGVRYPGIYEDLKRMTVEEVIAKQWVACSRQAEEDLAKVDPDLVLRYRYEDFVEAPVEHFERILRHFDLEMTPELERSLREQVDPGRRLKWKRLDPRVIKACLPILRDEMARHGYEVPEELAPLLEEGVPA